MHKVCGQSSTLWFDKEDPNFIVAKLVLKSDSKMYDIPK